MKLDAERHLPCLKGVYQRSLMVLTTSHFLQRMMANSGKVRYPYFDA
ncbi:hypothetical protein [Streptococcus suis]|nr:hypothetical protein [Streptococcus suis]